MRMAAAVRWLLPLLLLAASMPAVIYADDPGPTESECRPYIEKALKQLETPESTGSGEDTASLEEDENEQLILTPEDSTEPGIEESSLEESITAEDQKEETETKEGTESQEGEQISVEPTESEGAIEGSEEETKEEDKESEEGIQEENKEEGSQETEESEGQQEQSSEISEEGQDEIDQIEGKEESGEETKEESGEETKEESGEETKEESGEETKEESGEETKEESGDVTKEESGEETKEESGEETKEESEEETKEESGEETAEESGEDVKGESEKKEGESDETVEKTASLEEQAEEKESTEETSAEEKTEDSIEAAGEISEEQKDQDKESKEDDTLSEEEKKDESDEIQDETESEEKKDDEESNEGKIDEKDIDETNEDTESVEQIVQEEESDEKKEDETESVEEKTDIESEEGKEEVESIEKNAEAEESQETENLENIEEESREGQQEKSGEQEESEENEGVKSEEETKEESEEDSKEQEIEEKEVDDDAKDDSKEVVSEEVTAESVKLSEASPASEEEAAPEAESQEERDEESAEKTEEEPESKEESAESPEEEDLTLDFEIPENLRPRDHIGEILKLTTESAERELLLGKTIDSTLKELKRIYDSAIKPLELLYKYRDLSNRHFGDPEIFSKPLILFMGPWSGGKSTIINYLLDNEYKQTSLRTGAEPSPAYFNILMYGEDTEILDGTQLAADWTFSGLQKFGQGLLDRLRGLRLPSPLLEKVNIVEIPGILEIRKQIERVFPFNDACQWFIDRADIIFLVYDPSKLDVGPETEAILDQLKGREYQTRIILNKADQVKPEELMRVQGTLIWNISPLMSSPEPPVMYSTSLWSIPYEIGAPIRLLSAQERAFLRDFRQAIDRRVENKISSARRFAVRVRNHAKMVDCYLTTYYNHMSFFGNKKKVSDGIIDRPQDYHIYEGLSTLTNISRYDLPDPDIYRDFFRLNPLYEFQQLSATCTYFRGCPINRLDVAIAYDLPELVGKYKKSVEHVLAEAKKSQT